MDLGMDRGTIVFGRFDSLQQCSTGASRTEAVGSWGALRYAAWPDTGRRRACSFSALGHALAPGGATGRPSRDRGWPQPRWTVAASHPTRKCSDATHFMTNGPGAWGREG